MSVYLIQVLTVLFCVVNGIYGRRFGEEDFYPQSPYYERRQQLENQIKAALDKLSQTPSPQWVPSWPDPEVKLGQVSGVALTPTDQVLVLHRGPNVWDERTFTPRNVYSFIGNPPIDQPTILVFNDTGDLVDKWGENLFYMPHGITVDSAGNVWVTDVALHQVFKFTPAQRDKPALVLGEKFVPRDDETHFCKPTAVAVLASGEFFVADGYCNARIIKFAPDGTRLLQWGRRTGESPYSLNIPHALTLVPDRGLVCCADRERGRAACYRADNGTYVTGFRHWLIGPRLFSIDYAPHHGGRLYVVNGPSAGPTPVRGFVIDFESSRLISTFGPGEDLSNPHDIAVSPDGTKIYVVELDPFRVLRFEDMSLRNESRRDSAPPGGSTPRDPPAKPTAIFEVSSNPMSAEDSWVSWRGAAGGALGAAGGALLVLAALALYTARNRGKDFEAEPLVG